MKLFVDLLRLRLQRRLSHVCVVGWGLVNGVLPVQRTQILDCSSAAHTRRLLVLPAVQHSNLLLKLLLLLLVHLVQICQLSVS